MDTTKYEIMKENYLKTFNTVKGELVLNDLKKMYHYDSTTYYAKDGRDGIVFNEGTRSVILHILRMMEIK